MPDQIICRSVPVQPEVREDGDKLIIAGYAAVWYDPNEPGTQFELAPKLVERVRPGAFTASLNGDVKCLFNHNSDVVLGTTRNGTLVLEQDDRGLHYTSYLPLTVAARDIYTLVKRGYVFGSSFAFKIVRAVASRDGGVDVRELVEVKLYDVGPVTRPSYTATDVAVTDGLANAQQRAKRLIHLYSRQLSLLGVDDGQIARAD